MVAIQRASEQDNPAAMISGLGEVAKMLGYYAPERVNVELSDDQQRLQKKYKAMSDEELYHIACSGQERVNAACGR